MHVSFFGIKCWAGLASKSEDALGKTSGLGKGMGICAGTRKDLEYVVIFQVPPNVAVTEAKDLGCVYSSLNEPKP